MNVTSFLLAVSGRHFLFLTYPDVRQYSHWSPTSTCLYSYTPTTRTFTFQPLPTPSNPVSIIPSFASLHCTRGSPTTFSPSMVTGLKPSLSVSDKNFADTHPSQASASLAPLFHCLIISKPSESPSTNTSFLIVKFLQSVNLLFTTLVLVSSVNLSLTK